MPPKPQKHSFNIQVYLDVKVLAGLVRYSKNQNFPIQNAYSSITRDMLERILSMLVAAGRAEEVQTTSEALQILSSYGLPTNQGHEATAAPRIKALDLEDKMLDMLSPPVLGLKKPDEDAYKLLLNANVSGNGNEPTTDSE